MMSKGAALATIEECREVNRSIPKKRKCVKKQEIEDMTFEGLNKDQVRRLKDLLWKYKDRFTPKGTFPRPAMVRGHQIFTDGPPIATRPYRYSETENQVINWEVDKMLAFEIIRQSDSPWSSTIVLVRKANGKVRFCVDYRRLNAITKKDSFPMPRIDDTLDWIGKGKWFTTLDLASGYWQIPMNEEDRRRRPSERRRASMSSIPCHLGW